MSDETQGKPALTITEATERAVQEGKQSYADVKARVKELIGSEPSNTVIALARKKLNAPALTRGRKKKDAGFSTAPAATIPQKAVASKSVARCTVTQKTTSISATELIEFANVYNGLKAKHGEKFSELVSLSGKL